MSGMKYHHLVYLNGILDCTAPMSIEDIFDMACCHYSFVGDTIIVMSQSLKIVDEYKYRIIRHEKVVSEEDLYYTFKNSFVFQKIITTTTLLLKIQVFQSLH